MKNVLIGLLLLTTVLFAGLYVNRNEKARQAEGDIAALQKNLAELETRLDQSEKRTSTLRDRLQNTRSEAAARAGEAVQLRQSLTNRTEAVAAGTNGLANAFAEAFKKPEMRDMIHTQQKAVFGTMIDKNYADFFAALNLTPEQSAAFKEMLLQKMLVQADLGMEMLAGDVDPAKRADLAEQAKADRAAVDEQIKAFLGDQNFAQYQAYEKTLPDRMAIGQFRDQLAAGTSVLSVAQEQQLMQAMSEERQNFKFTTDYNDESKFSGDFSTYFTEAKMNQFFEEQGRLQQLYLHRAQSILSPDQLAAYQKFLVNQQEMQKAAMNMAAAMFAPKSGN